MSAITWTTERRRLGDLIEWDKNPRTLSKHDAAHIKRSMDTFGLADPLIINADNHLIGGHQRKHILHDPDTMVDVRVPSRQLTPAEAEELGIRLNKAQGDWDMELLANNWDVDVLKEWGFAEGELGLGDMMHVNGDKAGASPWDRMSGDSNDGVLFQFGAITCRVDQQVYDSFLASCPDDDIAGYIARLVI